MGKFYETIPEEIIPWILQQNVFWVASAPLAASGHVNLSPKGGKGFGVLDERSFWYCDLTGSGWFSLFLLIFPGFVFVLSWLVWLDLLVVWCL